MLLGSPAVVSAVDRRAVADVTGSPDASSSLVTTLHGHTAQYLESKGRKLPKNLGVSLTSSGFRIGKNKLGLGSSAAVAAGAVGALFELGGLPIVDHRSEILEVAKAGHFASQGGKGSGADVAAAVLGGTIVYRMAQPPVPVSIEGLFISVIWSGRSVSTAEMIAKIHEFQQNSPVRYRARMSCLKTGADAMADAFVRHDLDGIVNGARDYAAAMDALGTAAEVAIVTKPHRCLINMAEDLGGAAKPSGAGGGDIAVAFFTDPDAMDAFKVLCIRYELPVLELSAHAPGLRRETFQSH